MPNEVKLLPCPWCGEDEDIRVVDIEDCGPEGSWEATATCGRCEARAPTSLWYDTQAEATHEAYVRWNTRPTTVVTDEVVELRDALAEAKLQLEYMESRWPTGTTPAILARIDSAIASMPTVVTGEQPGWLPIESAPKGKRAILGFMRVGDGNVTRVLHWDDDDATWHSDTHDYAPTHWQPLPEPPAQPGDA